jgi:hypothetical protein
METNPMYNRGNERYSEERKKVEQRSYETHLLREIFKGNEHQIVQTSTYIRKASEGSSTADYLGEDKGGGVGEEPRCVQRVGWR